MSCQKLCQTLDCIFKIKHFKRFEEPVSTKHPLFQFHHYNFVQRPHQKWNKIFKRLDDGKKNSSSISTKSIGNIYRESKISEATSDKKSCLQGTRKEIITTGKSGNIREEEELELAKIADNMKTSSLSQS